MPGQRIDPELVAAIAEAVVQAQAQQRPKPNGGVDRFLASFDKWLARWAGLLKVFGVIAAGVIIAMNVWEAKLRPILLGPAKIAAIEENQVEMLANQKAMLEFTEKVNALTEIVEGNLRWRLAHEREHGEGENEVEEEGLELGATAERKRGGGG